MKKLILFLFSTGLVQTIYSQNNVGINTSTPHSKAALDIVASDKGVLIPRITAAAKAAMFVAADATAKGMLVYQTDAPSGFYFYDGSIWNYLGAGGGPNVWAQNGNDISNTNIGNVGIKTKTPAYPLTVNADGNGIALVGVGNKGQGTTVGLSTTNSAGYLKTFTNHPLYLTTNNSNDPQMALTTGGRLGLGTNLPLAKMDVRDTSENLLELTNTSSSRILANTKMYFKSGLNYAGRISTIGTSDTSARMGFSTGTTLDANTMKERLTISNVGNVGINNTNPTYKFDVKGDSRFVGDAHQLSGVTTLIADPQKKGLPIALQLNGGIHSFSDQDPFFTANGEVSEDGKRMKIDHILCNNNPSARLYVTDNFNTPIKTSYNYDENSWYIITDGYYIDFIGEIELLDCNNNCVTWTIPFLKENKIYPTTSFNVMVIDY